MKKQALTTIAVMIFLTLVSSAKTSAQSANQQLVADIPFSFTVVNETLPAGTYTVTVVNPASDQKVIKLSSVNGNKSAMLKMMPVKGSEDSTPRLVFRRYGDRHFLAQAWTSADSWGLEARKSGSE